MTNPSPLVLINSQSQLPNGVNVVNNSTVTISLASSAGVYAWNIQCVGTDELNTAAAINATLVVNSANNTATFTAPNSDGYGAALIFRSQVNSGIDINGLVQPYLTTTFGVYITIGGLRVGGQNETTEGNAVFGWLTKFNAAIRSAGGSITLDGDVTGQAGSNTVIAIQNNPVESQILGAAQDGYILTWHNASDQWEALPNDASIITLSGDVDGSSNANTVLGIDGHVLPSLSDGYLNWTGSAWQYSALVIPTTLPPSGSAGGDLGGSYPNPTVLSVAHVTAGVLSTANQANQSVTLIGDLSGTGTTASTSVEVTGLLSHALPSLSDGYLFWNGSTWQLDAITIPTSLPPNGSAGGDLSGTYPNPTVSAIQNHSVSTHAPALGQSLEFDGTNWIPYTSLNNLEQIALLKWSPNTTLPALTTGTSPLGICTYLGTGTGIGANNVSGAMVAESANLTYIINNTATSINSSATTIGCVSDGTYLWFILSGTSNNIVKFNPTTGMVAAIYSTISTQPKCITYYGGFVWIGLAGTTNNLIKIATSSGSAATFTAGAAAINCIYTDSNGFVWCGLASTTNNLIKIVSSTGATSATYTVGSVAITTITSDGTFIYATGQATLNKFSISGGTISNTYLMPATATSSLYDGTYVWFSGVTASLFMQFNISTAIISMYAGTGNTTSIYDDGTYVWAGTTATSNNLNRLTLGGTSNLIFGLADVITSITCCCYDATNTLLWFGTNGTTNNLIKCNGTTGAFIASYTVGSTAIEAIATGSDGFIWCGMNTTSSNLNKITASTGATAATYTVGAFACTGLYDDGVNVWYTNGQTSSNLYQFVISLGTSTAHTAGATAITCISGSSSSLVFVGNSATTNNLVKWTGTATSYTVGTTGIKSIYDDGTNIWCAMNQAGSNLVKVVPSTGVTSASYTIGVSAPTSVYSDATNVWVGTSNGTAQNTLYEFNIGSATVTNSIDPLGSNENTFVCQTATSGTLAAGFGIGNVANIALWTPANSYTVNTYTIGATAIEGLTDFGGNLYATANSATNAVFEITPSTAAVANNYNLFYSSNYICFDGNNFWSTSSANNEVIKLNIGSTYAASIFNQYTVGTNPQGICFDGYYVWCSNYTDNTISSITNAGVVAGPYTVGTNPQGICFDGTNIWVANYGSANVTKLLNGSTIGTFAVGTNPHDICFDGYHIWVTNAGSNTVTKLRPDGTTTGTYNVGTTPMGICFDGDFIWVANNGSNTVTQLNAINGTVKNTLTVGSNPTAICFDGVYVYVTNNGSNTVTKL